MVNRSCTWINLGVLSTCWSCCFVFVGSQVWFCIVGLSWIRWISHVKSKKPEFYRSTYGITNRYPKNKGKYVNIWNEQSPLASIFGMGWNHHIMSNHRIIELNIDKHTITMGYVYIYIYSIYIILYHIILYDFTLYYTIFYNIIYYILYFVML